MRFPRLHKELIKRQSHPSRYSSAQNQPTELPLAKKLIHESIFRTSDRYRMLHLERAVLLLGNGQRPSYR